MSQNPIQITIPRNAPRVGTRFFAWVGRLGLKLLGWEIHGEFANESKLIVVVAPHRSNLDWVIGVCTLWALQMKFSYLIKESVMVWPLSIMISKTGGIPINRSSPDGVIEQVIQAFREREKLYFAITPEGTRKEVKRWKSGFLRIAYSADVAVVPAFIDYDRKQIHITEPFELEGEVNADMQCVQSFFQTKVSQES